MERQKIYHPSMNNSPMAKYTIEDCENMSQEEFIELLEANNE